MIGLKASRAERIEMREREIVEETKEINLKRKRNRDEEVKKSGKITIEGWTKEQEVALQRAYLATKPTRHFWKKVSKLVLCFNVIPFWFMNIFLSNNYQ